MNKNIKVISVLIAGIGNSFAASTPLNDFPMAVSNMVKPNVLVIYDNSQSMDAYMNGTLVSGNDLNTRSNIGRSVMRNTISTYRNSFRWGLMTYGVSNNNLRKTYAYYLGSDSGMVFTDDCVGYVGSIPPVPGISASNGNRRCIENPQPFTGGGYVTYDKSGDDYDILDVLYTNDTYTKLWGLTAGAGTNYNIYTSHNLNNSWAQTDFTGGLGSWGFTPTDAGYLSENPPIKRQVYIPRGWGYIGDVTGYGNLNSPISDDSSTHYNSLINLLGNETNTATGEIKNSAVFTTLKGTLDTAKSYFSGNLSGHDSPINYSCQKNFVMLVTDGLPTGKTNGSLYSATERTNTCNWSTTTNSCTSGAFGTAATDAIGSISALRSTPVSGVTSSISDGTGSITGNFDIQTYVVALGDTVSNSAAVSVMNAMAYSGGSNFAMAAGNSTALQNAIATISEDIAAKDGSAAAVAVANANVTSGDNASYVSSYNSGNWTGDLIAYPINVTTGMPDVNSPIWNSGCSNPNTWVDSSDTSKGKQGCSAQVKLDQSGASNPPTNPIAASARKIVTYSGSGCYAGPASTSGCTSSVGLQFQPTTASTTTKLSTTLQGNLNTYSATDGANVVNYLRGDQSLEGSSGSYRSRAHRLGDIVNAEPVIMREPYYGYADSCYSAAVNNKCATSFKASKANRGRMVFQASNDGMLHAFNAADGVEAWAYIPHQLLKDASTSSSSNLLNNLSKKSFSHKYLIDATPVLADVDFSQTDGISGNPNPDWRTILVGGLGNGGRGYYALDVTCPLGATVSTTGTCNQTLDESTVAQKVLWEFPASAPTVPNSNSISCSSAKNVSTVNLVGRTFGKPIIVKNSSGQWVVLVSSGYNNGDSTSGTDYSGGDGKGYLFVLNPRSGAIIDVLCTSSGTAASPSGLAYISAYVDNTDLDNTVKYVYGGDLNGNLWRFNFTGNSPSVTKVAILKDSSGNTQPITTEPDMAKLLVNSVTRPMIYVGTGKLLSDTDVSTLQEQTVYGLLDDPSITTSGPVISEYNGNTRGNLQQQTFSTVSSSTRTFTSTNSVDYTGGTKKGWYVDLPISGERVNTNPYIVQGALLVTSNIPSTTSCVPGGSSWFNIFDYKTGGALQNTSYTYYSEFIGNALASRPVVIKLPGGAVKALIRTSDAKTLTKDVPIPGTSSTAGRISWREVTE